MLCLSRKRGQEIVIVVPPSSEPQTIRVCVVGFVNDKVRIGFDANEKVVIHRKEVADAIAAETKVTNSKENLND